MTLLQATRIFKVFTHKKTISYTYVKLTTYYKNCSKIWESYIISEYYSILYIRITSVLSDIYSKEVETYINLT